MTITEYDNVYGKGRRIYPGERYICSDGDAIIIDLVDYDKGKVHYHRDGLPDVHFTNSFDGFNEMNEETSITSYMYDPENDRDEYYHFVKSGGTNLEDAYDMFYGRDRRANVGDKFVNHHNGSNNVIVDEVDYQNCMVHMHDDSSRFSVAFCYFNEVVDGEYMYER